MSEVNKELKEKDMQEFLVNKNRLQLLYEWTQKGKVNLSQFATLMEMHTKEHKRQMELDSWN